MYVYHDEFLYCYIGFPFTGQDKNKISRLFGGTKHTQMSFVHVLRNSRTSVYNKGTNIRDKRVCFVNLLSFTKRYSLIYIEQCCPKQCCRETRRETGPISSRRDIIRREIQTPCFILSASGLFSFLLSTQLHIYIKRYIAQRVIVLQRKCYMLPTFKIH